jgi:hypothetical protein
VAFGDFRLVAEISASPEGFCASDTDEGALQEAAVELLEYLAGRWPPRPPATASSPMAPASRLHPIIPLLRRRWLATAPGDRECPDAGDSTRSIRRAHVRSSHSVRNARSTKTTRSFH